jgi:hypothetical protein
VELVIYKPTEGNPLPPVEWNFPELKKWLEDGLMSYRGRVYDETQIKEAKKDAANLRKLAAAIDSKRKDMKARYLEPYAAFEAQAKELTGMIDTQVAEIAAQITAFDEARKAEKLEHINLLYKEIMGDLSELVPYENIHNKRWLNATATMSAIEGDIIEKAESIRAALASIDALGLPDDMAGQVKAVYLDKLDLAAALAEKERIERRQKALADYEARMQQEAQCKADERPAPQEVPREALGYAEDEAPDLITVDFRIRATREQLADLKAFLVGRGIKYSPVPIKR